MWVLVIIVLGQLGSPGQFNVKNVFVEHNLFDNNPECQTAARFEKEKMNGQKLEVQVSCQYVRR